MGVTDQIATAALCFLPFVFGIGIWVAWSDMARMKIPNIAVMSLVGVFVVVGLGLVAAGLWSLETWAWRWAHLGVVLAVGFIANMAGAMGAGDAKFGAAMALFIPSGDALFFFGLLAVVIVVGFTLHRIARASDRVRARTPDWESWRRSDFPMGLCLSSALTLYVAIGAIWGL